MRWVLTRVSDTQPGAHEDLVNGSPAGAVVAPAGGDWASASLVVTMTLSAAYMTSLGPGMHHFYMTGVSKRGLSGFEKVDLKVV
jgi:hypothetical protein